MIKLFILGPTEIKKPDGSSEHSFLAGPKRLALLVYLLLDRPHGYHRRDSLLPLFWPEFGQKSARNALSNLLYHIRKTLGPEVILNRGAEEIKLDSNVFWSDVMEFNKAVKKGELGSALKYYNGELLKGFYVPQGSPELGQWLENERTRYKVLVSKSIYQLSKDAEERNDFAEAEKWSKKAIELNPLCEETMENYLSLLIKMKNPKKALIEYDLYQNRLKKELDEEPPGDLVNIVEKIKSKLEGNNFLEPNVKSNGVKISGHKKLLSDRIAVLPFETLGQQKASAFTDALHGDILTRMSNVSNLHVTSRESVLKFRSQDRSLKNIADELGVQWILGGEVRESLDTVQVNVRLVNTTEDRQVWAQNYLQDLRAEDFFEFQRKITQKIAEALETKFNNADTYAVFHTPTKNLESYCLHAQGRWCLDQRTESKIRKALIFFRQAIKLDPEYVLAWVGLADALILLNDYGYEKESLTLPEAEYAANKALSIEPNLAETNATLALLLGAKRDGPAAIKMLEKTVTLRPNYAEAYNWLSWGGLCMGNANESLTYSRKAVKLNPLSPEALSNLSFSLLATGDYDNSLKEAKRIQHIQSKWSTSYFYEGLAYYHLGEYEKAANVLRNLLVPWAGDGPKITLAQSYIKIGDSSTYNQLINGFLANNNHLALALIHASKGDKEAGYQHLLKLNKWDYWANLSLHHCFPNELNDLRSDHKYEEIKKRNLKSWKIEN